MSKMPLRAKETHAKGGNIAPIQKPQLKACEGNAVHQKQTHTQLQKEGNSLHRSFIGYSKPIQPLPIDSTTNAVAVTRKSPKHINLKKLLELVQTKQSRNLPMQETAKRPRYTEPPVKLQINSFMTQKDEPATQKSLRAYQDVSTDSTASNTIAASCASHRYNKRVPTKKVEPEVAAVRLAKGSVCVKKPLRDGEKLVASGANHGKTPDKHRGWARQAEQSNTNKRNKTPAIRLTLLPQTGMGPVKHLDSRKDITRNLCLVSSANQGKSRNQRALYDPRLNDLMIRTKPEEGEAALASPQQILSTRKVDADEGRQKDVVHKLHAKSQLRTFYGKQPASQLRKREYDVRPKNPCNRSMINVQSVEQGKVKKKTARCTVISAYPDEKPVATRSTIGVSIGAADLKEGDNNEINDISHDSDECKTVIENNCENDYSLMCNSINGMFP